MKMKYEVSVRVVGYKKIMVEIEGPDEDFAKIDKKVVEIEDNPIPIPGLDEVEEWTAEHWTELESGTKWKVN